MAQQFKTFDWWMFEPFRMSLEFTPEVSHFLRGSRRLNKNVMKSLTQSAMTAIPHAEDLIESGTESRNMIKYTIRVGNTATREIRIKFEYQTEEHAMYLFVSLNGELYASMGRQATRILLEKIAHTIDERMFITLKKTREARDLTYGEIAGLLRESEKTKGLVEEGSALDRALAAGILPQSVGKFLTSEDVKGYNVKSAIKSIKTKYGLGRRRKTRRV